MATTLLAIEIGGTKLQVAIGTSEGKIIQRSRFHVVATDGAEGIRRQIESALPELMALKPQAAAIGFGGPVHRTSGTVARSHQIQGWSDFPLIQWFTQLSGIPALVENDANIAALGEAHYGAGTQFDPVFYVTLGSGVGGGLVVGGQIYHGASPGEAEIGHVRLDPTGTTVESRCSGWAVDARIRQARQAAPHGLLTQLTAGSQGGEARHLSAACQAGDATAQQIVAETCHDLAFALSHVVHLIHPEVIILGGGLALLGEPLRAGVARALPNHLMTVFQPGPEMRLAALAEDAVPIGCLVAARQLLKKRDRP